MLESSSRRVLFYVDKYVSYVSYAVHYVDSYVNYVGSVDYVSKVP